VCENVLSFFILSLSRTTPFETTQADLEAVDWNPVLSETDVNVSFNKFIEIIQNTFNECFHFVKMSRKRANDKKWITGS
jgi:hypothetical protein